MRTRPLILSGLLSVVPLGLGLQSPPVPQSAGEPERRSSQQQYKDYAAQSERLRNQARQAFDAEMAREKAGDCRDAHTTYDSNICLGEAVKKTDANLMAYETAIRDRLSVKKPGVDLPPLAAAVVPLTPRELVAEFDKIEQAWRVYLDSACGAVSHEFIGGTGRAAADMECHLQLVRSHMRELDYVYYLYLHVCGGCYVSVSPQGAGASFAGVNIGHQP